MSTSQLEKAMATLRISLAEIRNKEGQLDTMISQFRTQLRRVPRQAVYGRMGLELAIAAMGEVEERLSDAENTRRRLLAIKKTATDELEALQLIKQVDEAKKSLSDLRRKVRETGGRRRNRLRDPATGALHSRPQQTRRTSHHSQLRRTPKPGLGGTGPAATTTPA